MRGKVGVFFLPRLKICGYPIFAGQLRTSAKKTLKKTPNAPFIWTAEVFGGEYSAFMRLPDAICAIKRARGLKV